MLVPWSGKLADGAQPVLIRPKSPLGDIVTGKMYLAPDLGLLLGEDNAVGLTELEDMANLPRSSTS